MSLGHQLVRRAVPEHCACATCALARQADKRDAVLMLRAERIRMAEVTPKQRADWDEYLEATRLA